MSVDTSALTPEEIDRLFNSPGTVKPNTYEFALVLGGTVSSGAYTAGALDFLFEALDSWTELRDTPGGIKVPRHKAVLRLITGTSGGGVNAAIAARALAYDFPYVAQGTSRETAAGNPFYDTWVNRLTLAAMLETRDLDGRKAAATSLLDGNAIDDAAARLIGFSAAASRRPPRSYLAAPLRLILTLTNLDGIPYRIGGFGQRRMSDGSMVDLSESYIDHADHARFAVVYPGQSATGFRPDEFVLGFDDARLPQALRWEDFGAFAMGTAAFPIGFPPRRPVRLLQHYRYRVVAVPSDTDPGQSKPVPLVPDWAAIQDWAGGIPEDYPFMVVDGGVTNNEPIELARTALAGIRGRNPRDGLKANRGVVLVDPFAGEAKMAGGKTMADSQKTDLLDLALKLTGGVVQQMRYDSRDLLLASYDDVYSRFMITAVRDNNVGGLALATAGLGAFLGFTCEAFRRHDYLLGRKNCQDYLKTQFVLPSANPIFAGCIDADIQADYGYREDGVAYMPIIPLVGSARVPETADTWPRGKLDPDDYRDAIEDRFTRLLNGELPSNLLTRALVGLAVEAGGGKLADFAIQKMKDALAEWHLT